MDNSYYTGATLIRASGGGGGMKYSTNLPLAGTPLLMQPNVLTGAPLIRKGQLQQLQQQTNGPGPPSSTPPGIICCFQPIYYIPNGGGTVGQGLGHNPILNFNNNKHHSINKQLSISPPLQQQQQQQQQNQPPKRKNYKTLQKLKPIKNGNNNSEELTTTARAFGMEVYRKSSIPDPISPPAKTAAFSRPRRESSSSSTTSSSSASSSALNSPTHFFTSSIESSKEFSNEEKQRNEKLLNFYFYEEHWRPKECDEVHNPNQQLENHSWEVKQNQQEQQSFDYPSTTTTSVKNSGLTISSVKNGNHKNQQKDLEVEAQIVTLANGHRDLEIRLCYVTS